MSILKDEVERIAKLLDGAFPDTEIVAANYHRDVLIKYLLVKVDIADWHGVSDAANDLRELEARYPATKKGGL